MVWPDPSGDSASGGGGDGEDSAVRRLREENETLQARLGALVSAQLRAAEAGTGTESQLTELRGEVATLKGALAQAEAAAQRQVSRTIVVGQRSVGVQIFTESRAVRRPRVPAVGRVPALPPALVLAPSRRGVRWS